MEPNHKMHIIFSYDDNIIVSDHQQPHVMSTWYSPMIIDYYSISQ